MIHELNRHKMWGVVLGNAKDDYHKTTFGYLIGRWMDEIGDHEGPPKLLFYTRQEAEAWAKQRSNERPWNYHAKKWNQHEQS